MLHLQNKKKDDIAFQRLENIFLNDLYNLKKKAR